MSKNAFNLDSDNRDELLRASTERVWKKTSEEVREIASKPIEGLDDLPKETKEIIEEAFGGPLAFVD